MREQLHDSADLVDNIYLLKVHSCQNTFKYICSQLHGFFTLGNFPDSRSHRFCIAGINPCNPEFESLHRYPLSCASVSEKSVSKTLCADQKSRQSFNRPHLEFFGRLCGPVLVRFSPHSFWNGISVKIKAPLIPPLEASCICRQS